METFQEAGVQMLKEFRALLQHSPLPLPETRLLQLLALNMFAIESTQLKGKSPYFFSACLFDLLSCCSFLSRFAKRDVEKGRQKCLFSREMSKMESKVSNSRLLSWNYSCRGHV